ncbi:50S ribosomal protein 5, chloroplastic [Quillaja saponaria]|uniref:50S ribosomal protein 5, chloroplastic n=1 Tax=Quillaja saponaria TaxID=32244 RepID=A0AAD7Q7Z5_QUISA|nr:50S ribosomal protein 5, chloroplastic [Quillaja saponaria]
MWLTYPETIPTLFLRPKLQRETVPRTINNHGPSLLQFSNSSHFISLFHFINFGHGYYSRLHIKVIDLPSNSINGMRICTPFSANRTGRFIVRAASDVDGAAPTDGAESPSDSKKEVLPVDKLPLESKLQERQEQKLRMKLAKKIRLRRKRLVRKRRLRKKGRWPPSKMKKLKNV